MTNFHIVFFFQGYPQSTWMLLCERYFYLETITFHYGWHTVGVCISVCVCVCTVEIKWSSKGLACVKHIPTHICYVPSLDQIMLAGISCLWCQPVPHGKLQTNLIHAQNLACLHFMSPIAKGSKWHHRLHFMSVQVQQKDDEKLVSVACAWGQGSWPARLQCPKGAYWFSWGSD